MATRFVSNDELERLANNIRTGNPGATLSVLPKLGKADFEHFVTFDNKHLTVLGWAVKGYHDESHSRRNMLAYFKDLVCHPNLDVNAVCDSENQRTVFHLVCGSNNQQQIRPSTKLLNALLDVRRHGKIIDPTMLDNQQLPPIYYALKQSEFMQTSKNFDVFRNFMIKYNEKFKNMLLQGQTLLHLVCGKEIPVKVIEIFLELGFDPDKENGFGESCLKTALKSTNTNSLELQTLFKNSLDKNVLLGKISKDEEKDIISNEAIKRLLDAGISFDEILSDQYTPTFYILFNKTVSGDLVEKALQQSKPDVPLGESKSSILHFACRENDRIFVNGKHLEVANPSFFYSTHCIKILIKSQVFSFVP